MLLFLLAPIAPPCRLCAVDLDSSLFSLALSNTPKPLRQVLAQGETSLNAKNLVDMLPSSRVKARWGLVNGTFAERPFLDADQCSRLIEFAQPRLTRHLDTVDGAPSYEVDVPLEYLPDLRNCTAFVRRYSPETRPRLPFHVDKCQVSVSVNLSPADDYEGGDLLLFAHNALQRATREQGRATVHDANVAHAISDLTSGTRWSLVLFCDDPRGPFPDEDWQTQRPTPPRVKKKKRRKP